SNTRDSSHRAGVSGDRRTSGANRCWTGDHYQQARHASGACLRGLPSAPQPPNPALSPKGHSTNRVLVFLDHGTMTRQEGTDKQTITFRRGDVRWRPASGAYVAEKTSDQPIRILKIDLKGPPAGPAPVTKLDPTVVDERHYKVLFENDHVRVVRVHYDR